MGMVTLDACIYTIIAVIGVAYPILLQVISRLDDKYSSVRAVGLFEEEPARKWFEYFLYGSVLAVIVWYLKIPPPPNVADAPEWLKEGMANSALWLVYLTTIGLLISFFLLARKIITYYNAQKLSGYLQDSYRKNRSKEQYFEVLSDIFLAAVAARNSPLTSGIAEFFSEQFALERSREGDAINLPTAYYQLTYRASEELALQGTRKHKGLAQLATGGGWLLGGHRHHIISEHSYSALWHNIRIALDYGQEDMVYAYWSTAHQFMELGLKRIAPEYEKEDYSLRVINEQAIAFRVQEQTRFLEFHHVLCALLLYTGKRELLRRLFDYTNSQPPRYVLLPDHMTEIFTLFVNYYHPADRLLPLDVRYFFPNEAGLASESLITKWLFNYMAVLFLRQYTLRKYMMYDEPLAFPMLPEGQPAKKKWLSAVELFRRYIAQALQDTELLQALRLEVITQAWCSQKGVEHPLDFLSAVEKNLQDAYQQGAVELGLSREKVMQFCTDSGRIVEQAAEAVLSLAMPDGARIFRESRYLEGRQILVDKDAFAEEPEVSHLNFSSALASGVASDLTNNVARLFVRNKAVTYRVRPQDVFAALDKLSIGQDHVIINLGLNLSYLASQAGIQDCQSSSYKGTDILDFQVGSLPESLFIMKRTELPTMRFLPSDPVAVEKYELTEISQRHKLYASVLDANSLSNEVAAEVQKGDFGDFAEEKLKSQALEIIWLLLEFKWQQDAKLVWLIAPYHEEGSADDLAAIMPF